MKLAEMKVNEFVNEIDSKSATPGGGSVSALACSMGVALTRMVGHLSNGKKKFRALDESVQNEFNEIINSFLPIKEELIDLIDKDTEAFNLIMAAFKLPKETDSEKTLRRKAIQDGTNEAIKVPLRVATLSLEVLKKLELITKHGNKNTLSDLGVGTLMLYAGLEGAIMNVKINISGLSDESLAADYSNQIEQILKETVELKNQILSSIHSKL